MDMQSRGILVHFIADAEGRPLPAVSDPADADERKQGKPPLEGIEMKTGRPVIKDMIRNL